MNKLPPFAKPLFELQKTGYKPTNDIYLFTGYKAWEKGKAFSISYPQRVMIIPPWYDPCDYTFPVNGCGVMLFDSGYALDEYIETTAACLFRDGATKIYFIPTDYSQIIIYNKED